MTLVCVCVCVQHLPFDYTNKHSQVRSECLTCIFRASCCRARLSRAQVLLSGTGGGGVRGGGPPALAGTREYKQSDRNR